MIRGRADGRSNMMWWYGGGGDVDPPVEYEYTDGLTTTEDLTEFSDHQIRGGPTVYPTYRVPRAYGPAPYYYPVKKKSRRQYVPNSYGYHGPSEVPGIPKSSKVVPAVPLRYRRSSRSLLKPRRRSGFTITEPPSYPPVMRKKKMFVYSGPLPTEGDEDRQHAKVFWRKTKNTPSRRKIVSYCTQAVDSSTSADGKSVRSTYSRLSVDVSNEMAAMNRDIETILSRYESAFDQTLMNELEERGFSKKKKVTTEATARSSMAHRLSPEQKNLLTMEKPPLDRLADIPFEYLKPRPPKKTTEALTPERAVETHSGLKKDEIWKSMLQDLVSRGIMGKIDDASMAKLQTALNQVSEETKSQSTSKFATPPGIATIEDSSTSGKFATCVSLPDETIALNEIDKRIAESAKPAVDTENSRPTVSRLPNLVERSEELIPVNTLDDETNWRRKLKEIQEVSQTSCNRCQSLTEQLNVFKCGGSGDTVVIDDKSGRGTSLKEELAKINARLSRGDQGDTHQEATTNLMENVRGTASNITVNTVLTNHTAKASSYKGESSTTLCDEVHTNSTTAEVKAGIGVKVEDVEDEEEVPLLRKDGSVSIGRGSSTKQLYRRRPHTPISMTRPMENFSETQRAESKSGCSMDANQGGGDKLDASVIDRGLASLAEQISRSQDTNELERNLAELDKSITRNAVLLNTRMCCRIIRKLTNFMISSEPVFDQSRKMTYTEQFRDLRQNHLRHINRELEHIEYLDDFYRRNLNVRGFSVLTPKTNPASPTGQGKPEAATSQRSVSYNQ